MSVWILILEIPTFLRTLLLGLLSLNGNGRGICIRTYVYLSIYKTNFGLYEHTAPFATVRKLKCGTPTTSFSFVKKMTRQPCCNRLHIRISYHTYVHCNVLLLLLLVLYTVCVPICCFAFAFLCFAQNFLQDHFLHVLTLLLILVFVHCFC